MKKEIKDYLHFYLPTKQCDTEHGGCINSLICNQNDRCQRQSSISVFIFPDDSLNDGFLKKYLIQFPKGIYNPQLTFDNYKRFLKDGYKPILRPLSDMTEEEAKEARYIMIEYSNLRFKCDEKDTIKYRNVFIYDSVGEEGEHYSTSFSSPENLPSKIVPWMCKHGFDIFDLIRQGLAIDKTEIEKAIK